MVELASPVFVGRVEARSQGAALRQLVLVVPTERVRLVDGTQCLNVLELSELQLSCVGQFDDTDNATLGKQPHGLADF